MYHSLILCHLLTKKYMLFCWRLIEKRNYRSYSNHAYYLQEYPFLWLIFYELLLHYLQMLISLYLHSQGINLYINRSYLVSIYSLFLDVFFPYRYYWLQIYFEYLLILKLTKKYLFFPILLFFLKFKFLLLHHWIKRFKSHPLLQPVILDLTQQSLYLYQMKQ